MQIHSEHSSDLSLAKHTKADISFKIGWEKYRTDQRKPLAIHVIQMAILLVFLPLDVALLEPDFRIIITVSISLAVAILSFIIVIVFYCKIFGNNEMQDFLTLAKELQHATEERIDFPDSF